MRVPAKIYDYSTKAAGKGSTVCIGVDTSNAAPLPYDEDLPPRDYVPVKLTISSVTYDARLFARKKVPYVWVSTTLERNGKRERLSDVLSALGIYPNMSVTLDVNGASVVLL